ncbi:hypothetical protein BLNAU_5855 [Blattamonas nauphoetae]|uniref:Uncharacterized protein n=1 Tax=Blattamonas nauphoetae TaxID=2049346 RepID=A0ABQ9Y5T9_9EUKA|nr:hypothetical protein BLNAU_5855 [Blattamonas nauphoetae]
MHLSNYLSLRHTVVVNKTSSHPQVDNTRAKQTILVEVFLCQICGECKSLRPVMLNDLLVLATDSDWALSTILNVEYIKALEEYCSKTQPCDVPTSLPKLLYLIVPSASTDGSSELVPFAGRLCSTLAEHVSEMKSLFAESSASDGTISSFSASLPQKSPLLDGNTVLGMLCEELALLNSLLSDLDNTFDDMYRTALLIKILDCLWYLAAYCVCHESLHPAVETTFADVPQLCSLLERTCRHSSPTHSSHLRMIINLPATFPRLIPRMLEENLVQRVVDPSNPITVPMTHGDFHLDIIWAIINLIWDPKNITEDKEDKKRIQKLQFERALKPSKQYLQFILQREELISTVDTRDKDLPYQISDLLTRTLLLERYLFEDGEIVETGSEEWEVGWLVEKTNEDELGEILKMIREDDVRIKKNEKSRWKRRVERQREAGHEEAFGSIFLTS